MPTGYTADLEGVTFPEFALRCARAFGAFGALVTMRDESSDAPIPDCIEPSKYSLNRLAATVETLLEVESWDAPCAEREAKAAYEQALQRRAMYLTESGATRKCYENMIERVKDWTPPGPDHEGLKEFMLKQLTESMRFDCLDDSDLPKPELRSGQEHKQARLCRLWEDIEYHTKSYREELVRSRERTDWLLELRISLDGALRQQEEK